MAYLDNIIIYFNSKEEHFQYIKWVLQRLIDKKMPVAIKKYKFYIIVGNKGKWPLFRAS